MIGRIRGLSLTAQVVLLLAVTPVVVSLLGLTVAPLAVEVSMSGNDPSVVDEVAGAVRVASGLVALCAAIASLGAAALLRGSIRTTVDQLHEATDVIASGGFRHRIDSRRRDELGQLADAIDSMASRLECLEESRRRVLACVSHELRTPLTIVRGHLFTIGRHATDPDLLGRLRLVESEAVRLGSLIDQLMDAATLHAGGVQLERSRVDLAQIAAEAAMRFSDSANERGIAIVVRRDRRSMHVLADPARMHQAVGNLLANAVRHAAAGSSIELRLRASRGRHGRRTLAVRNVGSPICDADRDRIFEPFVQTGDVRGQIGLGLPIARDLVIAHGGELTLEASGARDGAVEFVIALPEPPRATNRAARSLRARSVRRSTRRTPHLSRPIPETS